MLARGPAPVKNEGAPPILPGLKPPKLAGPPLAGGLGGVGAKVPVLPVKGTKVEAKPTAHGTIGRGARVQRDARHTDPGPEHASTRSARSTATERVSERGRNGRKGAPASTEGSH